MFDIEFSPKVSKSFFKLDKQTQERISGSLDRIRIRPFSFVKKVVGTKMFALRSGDYRHILEIKKNKLIILVIELGHRRTIYKSI